jgi:3-oxoacyl-[acyl-carrier protein] reductase/meso-butanediol dehydrogenase/(S,S)-butanediol dehydrogenase/diacetyl reductase
MASGAHRVVGITGGTRGIGRAVAERFFREGADVAVCSRSARPASFPEGMLHCRADVRRRAEVQAFVEAAVRRFGGLDVLVNCAGVSRWRPVEAIDEAFVEEVIQTSLLGTLWSCQAAAATLREGGCIVNVSSLAGKRGSANNSAYCAAKFAVNGITQSLAKELGPRGIRINAVCPVYVSTEQVMAALSEPSAPAQGQAVAAYLSAFASTQTALGRLPSVEDVAAVVWFLASEAASAVTGQCVNVDCGTFPQ